MTISEACPNHYRICSHCRCGLRLLTDEEAANGQCGNCIPPVEAFGHRDYSPTMPESADIRELGDFSRRVEKIAQKEKAKTGAGPWMTRKQKRKHAAASTNEP